MKIVSNAGKDVTDVYIKNNKATNMGSSLLKTMAIGTLILFSIVAAFYLLGNSATINIPPITPQQINTNQALNTCTALIPFNKVTEWNLDLHSFRVM